MAHKITEAISLLPPEAQYFSLEFFPPKTTSGLENLLPRLHRLRALQPLFICVTYSAGGSQASKSVELASLCQNQLGFRTCLHLTCTNSRRGTIDWVLEECKRVGVRNILALRGDEPREGEYGGGAAAAGVGAAATAKEERFEHAADLIRYIRMKHGDYFCIGAACYPEGYPVSSSKHAGAYFQSPEHDLPYLIEKVEAGADFLLSQLFYNVDAYLAFERLLREDPRARACQKLQEVPLVPGLMPIQGWMSFVRTCKLARVKVPEDIDKRVREVKEDDEAVKSVGVDIVSEIIAKIQTEGKREQTAEEGQRQSQTQSIRKRRRPQGFHFYTLNLEKAVAQILEQTGLLHQPNAVAPTNGHVNGDVAVVDTDAEANVSPPSTKARRHRDSSAHNRILVNQPSASEYETDNASPNQFRDKSQPSDDALATSELGREATWDDFPNGRWGDARSPAYAPTNNYSSHPNLNPTTALKLWSTPTSVKDVTDIFRRYLLGGLAAIPWSEEEGEEPDKTEGTDGGLRPETAMIKDELLAMTEKGWWTVASQPAVDAVSSGDDVVGWGPRKGGFVWQKPFVEFFLPSSDWFRLRKRLDLARDEVLYFAGNAAGEFDATDEKSVNPVTWGCFKGKEIITPTIVEGVSFRAWQDEAFTIWREWQTVFPTSSSSAKLLGSLADDLWLVNVIGHDYVGGKRLWEILVSE